MSCSCVTSTIVMPCVRFKRCSKSSTSRLVRVSRFPVGSSASKSGCSVPKTRARARGFWRPFAGFALATVPYLDKPELAGKAARLFALPKRVLEAKYGADALWISGLAGGSLRLGRASRVFDSTVIDGLAVNGSARVVDLAARVVRRVQSGHLYHYAFAMILGLIVLLAVVIRAGQ